MGSYYTLWDMRAGTSLGTYEDLGEALAIVRDIADQEGAAAADDVELGFRAADGNWSLVGTGAALVVRAAAGAGRAAR